MSHPYPPQVRSAVYSQVYDSYSDDEDGEPLSPTGTPPDSDGEFDDMNCNNDSSSDDDSKAVNKNEGMHTKRDRYIEGAEDGDHGDDGGSDFDDYSAVDTNDRYDYIDSSVVNKDERINKQTNEGRSDDDDDSDSDDNDDSDDDDYIDDNDENDRERDDDDDDEMEYPPPALEENNDYQSQQYEQNKQSKQRMQRMQHQQHHEHQQNQQRQQQITNQQQMKSYPDINRKITDNKGQLMREKKQLTVYHSGKTPLSPLPLSPLSRSVFMRDIDSEFERIEASCYSRSYDTDDEVDGKYQANGANSKEQSLQGLDIGTTYLDSRHNVDDQNTRDNGPQSNPDSDRDSSSDNNRNSNRENRVRNHGNDKNDDYRSHDSNRGKDGDSDADGNVRRGGGVNSAGEDSAFLRNKELLQDKRRNFSNISDEKVLLINKDIKGGSKEMIRAGGRQHTDRGTDRGSNDDICSSSGSNRLTHSTINNQLLESHYPDHTNSDEVAELYYQRDVTPKERVSGGHSDANHRGITPSGQVSGDHSPAQYSPNTGDQHHDNGTQYDSQYDINDSQCDSNDSQYDINDSQYVEQYAIQQGNNGKYYDDNGKHHNNGNRDHGNAEGRRNSSDKHYRLNRVINNGLISSPQRVGKDPTNRPHNRPRNQINNQNSMKESVREQGTLRPQRSPSHNTSQTRSQSYCKPHPSSSISHLMKLSRPPNGTHGTHCTHTERMGTGTNFGPHPGFHTGSRSLLQSGDVRGVRGHRHDMKHNSHITHVTHNTHNTHTTQKHKPLRQKATLPRLQLLLGYLNTLHLSPNTLETHNFHSELRSGVFLIRLIQHLDPTAVFVHVSERARSVRAAVENIEQVLGVVLRTKRVDSRRVPTARELYDGPPNMMTTFLFELFYVYIERPWGGWSGSRATDMLSWFDSVLCQYGRPLKPDRFADLGWDTKIKRGERDEMDERGRELGCDSGIKGRLSRSMKGSDLRGYIEGKEDGGMGGYTEGKEDGGMGGRHEDDEDEQKHGRQEREERGERVDREQRGGASPSYDRHAPPLTHRAQRDTRTATHTERNTHSERSTYNDSPHKHFRTGTDIFCVLYHFYGPRALDTVTPASTGVSPTSSDPVRPRTLVSPTSLGVSSTSEPGHLRPRAVIDPSRVLFNPTSLSELRSNVTYVFDLLEALGVSVFYTVDEWIAFDDPAFMILLLEQLYQLCRDRVCVVPLADTLNLTPGLTLGPFGVPVVVGVCYADTPLPPPSPPLTPPSPTSPHSPSLSSPPLSSPSMPPPIPSSAHSLRSHSSTHPPPPHSYPISSFPTSSYSRFSSSRSPSRSPSQSPPPPPPDDTDMSEPPYNSNDSDSDDSDYSDGQSVTYGFDGSDGDEYDVFSFKDHELLVNSKSSDHYDDIANSVDRERKERARNGNKKGNGVIPNVDDLSPAMIGNKKVKEEGCKKGSKKGDKRGSKIVDKSDSNVDNFSPAMMRVEDEQRVAMSREEGGVKREGLRGSPPGDSPGNSLYDNQSITYISKGLLSSGYSAQLRKRMEVREKEEKQRERKKALKNLRPNPSHSPRTAAGATATASVTGLEPKGDNKSTAVRGAEKIREGNAETPTPSPSGHRDDLHLNIPPSSSHYSHPDTHQYPHPHPHSLPHSPHPHSRPYSTPHSHPQSAPHSQCSPPHSPQSPPSPISELNSHTAHTPYPSTSPHSPHSSSTSTPRKPPVVSHIIHSPKGPNMSPNSTTPRTPPLSAQMAAESIQKTADDNLRAEKGWVQHTDGGYTHNILLNEKRALAIQARMESYVPPKLRESTFAPPLPPPSPDNSYKRGLRGSGSGPISLPGSRSSSMSPPVRSRSPAMVTRERQPDKKRDDRRTDRKDDSTYEYELYREVRENELAIMQYEDDKRKAHYNNLRR